MAFEKLKKKACAQAGKAKDSCKANKIVAY